MGKDENEVDELLKSIKTKTDQWEFLKDNFRARDWGLGLTQFHQAWTVNGRKVTMEELVEELKNMIRAEKKLKNIPTKPPADFSSMKRRNVPIYGTPTPELEALDRKRQAGFQKVKTQAAARIAERHIKREGSLYCQMQPIKTPSWDSLVNERIDALFDMEYKKCAEGDDKEQSEVE